MDHNPFLRLSDQPAALEPAKGEIEPRRPENLVWQTRAAPPTEYETRLADALEEVFEAGHESLEQVVAGLNATTVRAPDGKSWDEASFQAVVKRLGDG